MPVTVVVGGQFGSEGKGKVAHWIARTQGVGVAVRVGGPNSGHTAVDENGASVIFRHLPTAALLPDVICVLGAGTLIDVDVLLAEVERSGLSHERLAIDQNATIITAAEREKEQQAGLRQTIGSTLTGTGAALERRMQRHDRACLAASDARLAPYVRPVRPLLRSTIEAGRRVLIEGTQGFGLSLLHSPHYPHVTSRDTTAATFVAEAGLSPLDVDQVYLVLRAFPIRVGGNSGPLPNEIDWKRISHESGSHVPLVEYTSVTKAVRRVARFSPDIVREAIAVNRPTHVVLNHLDQVDAQSGEMRSETPSVRAFVNATEQAIDHEVNLLGLGPELLVPNRAISLCSSVRVS